jgi:flagellar motility protein MotE (MotC chaperone)
MLKKLASPWISSVIGLISFLTVTAVTWNVATRNITIAHEAATSAATATTDDPDAWLHKTVESETLIKELREERNMLAKREKDLNELSARLNAERNELTQLTQTVHRMQKEFDSTVTRVADEESINLKKLAKTYATMEPEGAAGIFKQMDDSSVVKIMMFMKDQETAPILSALSKGGEAEAKRVGDLTERLRLAVIPKKK